VVAVPPALGRVMYIPPWPGAPCCIAPVLAARLRELTLGDANPQSLREIWNGPAYSTFREALLSDCRRAACGQLRIAWSL